MNTLHIGVVRSGKQMSLVWMLFIISISVHAQSHNGIIYQKLMQDFLLTEPPVRQIGGTPVQEYMPDYAPDSTATATLEVGFPTVSYEKLAKKQYLRLVSVSLTRKDSVMKPHTVSFRDTLTNRELRRVYRRSPEALRGNDPTPMSVWIRPVILVTVSIGTVISIFYIRSRE